MQNRKMMGLSLSVAVLLSSVAVWAEAPAKPAEAAALVPVVVGVVHPQDGLIADEYKQVTAVLREAKHATDKSLYPLIELIEPVKAEVLAWKAGGKLPDRRAMVHFSNETGVQEAVVNITQKKVEDIKPLPGEAMVTFVEFMSAMETALGNDEFIKALAKRNVKPDEAFCLPLTAGNFFIPEEKGQRLMKVPCYVKPTGSNFYAKPLEGLYALVELKSNKVLKVIDEAVVPAPKDDWGYTEEEVATRVPLRPEMNPARLAQTGKPNYTISGSEISWDIWKFRYRTDKRPGMVVSDITVNDGKDWRSVLYQAHLSEVFVPYQDPSQGWYWRTYMDSGEYGFGLFLSPLTAGVDCPAYASFLPAIIHDDNGNPLEIPNAICVFERSVGDPAWRHFEVFAQTPEAPVPAEGRPETELVMRTASEVGNYDYLVDYRFKQNGEIYIMVGASGLDAVKGVVSTSMQDATAKADTSHGTLIAPYLVAANHDHFFNFRLDFDIDGQDNTFMVMDLVKEDAPADVPRRSLWNTTHQPVTNEMDGRFKISALQPKMFHIMNMNKSGPLGHNPSYMIHHGNVAYSPFDFVNDAPMKRNAYVEYSIWNTLYDPNQRYAGGKYAFASDGSDTLAEWVKANRNIANKDVVTWFTAGFHHVPRMEDWPVMTTEWKTVHIMPFNFFPHNPALTIRKPK